mmetsp:Transcript_11407/g.32309  ORF Transcript_11407/g.32309 Transcript_11407/m.32309 type:complete len:290 (-) Transcript_11407:427-1296(-)
MTWNNAWKAFNKKEAFAPECKERGSKYPHKLSELSEDGRAIVGVDVSVWLHSDLAYKGVYSASAITPPVPNVEGIQRFFNRVAILEKANVTPWFIFDGRRFSAKEATDEERSSTVDEAKARLNELCRNPSLQKIKQVDQCLKNMARPDEKYVSQIVLELKKRGHVVIGAPIEADAQLVYLESEGYVDALMSPDGDLLALGCSKLVADVNWQTSECFIVTCDDVFERGGNKKADFNGAWDAWETFAVASCFMGNDYIDPLRKINGKNALPWPTLLKSGEGLRSAGGGRSP